MKEEPVCVSPQDTIEDAACRMRDENIGFLPVCDQSRTALGALTDRDIAVRAVAEKKPASTLVEDVMTREVVACHPQDELAMAEHLMTEYRKSRIMCTDDDGRLCGIISLTDIVDSEGGTAASDILRQVCERESASR
ncbi:MAG TPA: CBS domain-containing protein [Anaeromyxobacteraceae bacterium]|nr:CBS domain-containing protein [Anaeromyxobacteraceae bacterium]